MAPTQTGGNWWDEFPDAQTSQPVQSQQPNQNWWDEFPDYSPTENFEKYGSPTGPEGPVAQLPEPSENIYEGVQPQDQKLVYEAYRKHPQSVQDEKGDVWYKGLLVPFPAMAAKLAEPVLRQLPGGEKISEGVDQYTEFAHRLPSNITGGVYNVARNVGETALAARDLLTGRQDAPEFSEKVPEYDPRDIGGNWFDKLLVEGVEIGAGTVGGGAMAGQAVSKIAPQIPNFIRRLAQFAGAEAGMATTVDPNIDTLLVGDKSMLKLIGGLGLDPEGNYSEELLKKRLNILLDSAIVTPAGAGVARLGGETIKFINDIVVKPALKFFDPGSREKALVKNIMEQLLDITGEETPQELAEKQQKIIELIEKNKEIIFKTGDERVEDIQIIRDTMSAIEKGTTDPSLIARAKGIRQKIEGKGAPKIEEAITAPMRESERVITQTEEVLGGQEAATKTRETLQEAAQKEMDTYLEQVSQARQRVIESEEGINSLLKEDPTFGPLLKELGDQAGVDIDISSRTADAADKILEKVNEASEIMTKRKNDLFNSISSGLPVDIERLNDFISPEGARGVSDILEGSPLMAKLGQAATDFKELYNFVNLDLQKEIDRLVSEQKFDDANILRDFKHHVQNDQLQYVIDTTADESAKRAMDYYKTYATFWRDGRLQDIQDLQRKYKLSPRDKQVEQRKVLTGTLGDPKSREYTEQIAELLKSEEGGKNPGLILDYVLGDIASELQKSINISKTGAIDPQDIRKFSNTLDKFVPIFKSVDPDQIKRINTFLTKLKDKQISKAELQKELDELIKKQSEIEKEIFSGRFKEFFKEEGGVRFPRTSNKAVYTELFKNPDVVDKLPTLMKEAKASGGKEAVKGLQAAYVDYLKDNITRFGRGRAGEPMLEAMTESELKTLFDKGDVLFEGEEKQLWDAIKFVTTEAFDTLAKRGPGQAGAFDITEITKEARGALDFLVTWTVGVLNRTAARARSALGRGLSRLDPKDEVRRTLDIIMSDPDQFIKFAKTIQKEDLREISPRTKRELYKFFVKLGIYNEGEEDQFNQDFESFNLNQVDFETQEILK